MADGRVRAWSRNGRDITAACPEPAAPAATARRRTLVLDGEIVAFAGLRPDDWQNNEVGDQHRMAVMRA